MGFVRFLSMICSKASLFNSESESSWCFWPWPSNSSKAIAPHCVGLRQPHGDVAVESGLINTQVFLSPDLVSLQTEKRKSVELNEGTFYWHLPFGQQLHKSSFWFHNGKFFLSFLRKMFILKMIVFLPLLWQAFTIVCHTQSKEEISFWIILLWSDKVY